MNWLYQTWFNHAVSTLTVVALALYFGFLGLVNIRRRPTVVGGRLDFLVVILVFLPLLFRPLAMVVTLGNWAWKGAVIGALVLVLWLLLPREFTSWVIYSVSESDVVRSLERILWRRHIPYSRRDRRIQCDPPYGTLVISNMPILRNVTLYLEGGRDRSFFRRIGRDLQEELGKVKSVRSPSGHCFLAISVMLLLTPLVLSLVEHQGAVAAWLRRWLWAG